MEKYMRNNIIVKPFISMLALLLLTLSTPIYATFILSYQSSPHSTIGAGNSLYASSDVGYLFSVNQSSYFDNSQHFHIASPNSPFGPNYNPSSGNPWNQWRLDISAPYLLQLEVGMYDDASRWPFQDRTKPGLNFTENSIGHSNSSGSFLIHEIEFSSAGILTQLALDFTLYEVNDINRWIHGSFRFDSEIPVSVNEPSILMLFLTGIFIILAISNKKIAFYNQ